MGAGDHPGAGWRAAAVHGDRSGVPAAVLAFEPRRSDLPLQVAFPILMANLTGELLGGSSTPLDSIVPGSPVTLPIPDGATGIRVERPGRDGRSSSSPPTPDTRSIVFSRTELLGVYTVTPILAPVRRAAPTRRRRPRAVRVRVRARVRGRGWRLALGRPDAAARGPGRAAALRRRPVRRRRIEHRARLRRRDRGPGRRRRAARRGPSQGAAAARPAARDELWVPLACSSLVFLLRRVGGLRARHARPTPSFARRAAGRRERARTRRLMGVAFDHPLLLVLLPLLVA